MILKGHITLIKENGKIAQVEALGKIYDDVTLLYSYGEASNIEPDETSQVLLFKSMDRDDNVFGVPINIPLQPSTLEPTEKQIGNLKKGNIMTFKANGDIEIFTDAKLNEIVDTLETTATTEIKLVAPEINLADAIDLVLNQSAVMNVTIPGGSSAGTYPVTIVSAGQTKVKA